MSDYTHVELAAPCPRCGSYVGNFTHVCPAPSTSSVIVPGGHVVIPAPPEAIALGRKLAEEHGWTVPKEES